MLEHHYSPRREKSSLKRFLTWLTFLSLTSFFLHPDGMIWIILHWSMIQTQRLIHHTVELCGYDTTNSTTLLWAALGWVMSALLSVWYLLHKMFPVKQLPLRVATPVDSGFDFSHLKGCKKSKRKEKKSRAIFLNQRDSLSPLPSPRISTHANDFCCVTPPIYTSPISSPTRVSQARLPEPIPSISPLNTALEVPKRDSLECPNTSPPASNSTEQPNIEPIYLVESLIAPTHVPESNINDTSQPINLSPIEESVHEATANSTEMEVQTIEPDNNDIDEEVITNELQAPVKEVIEEAPEEVKALTKDQLFAFLSDPKTTAPSIRHYVANGLIDSDMVLAMESSEFTTAKVPQLATRMLYISVMSNRDLRYMPAPIYNRGAISPPSRVPPPPGFSAMPSNNYYRPVAHRYEEPIKHSLDMNHQYERDMELISNQMTMNVLD